MAERRAPHVTCILLNPTIDHVHEVEHFKAGGTYKASTTRVFPVGKAISVALGLRALDDEPSVIALVGKEEMGIYRASLDNADISATFVSVDGRTRRNVTIVDTAEHTVTHVREGGFIAGEMHLAAIEAAIDRLPQVIDRWVVISGSIPPGLPDNAISRLAARCKARGIKVLVDASGPPLKATFKGGKPWVVKINDTELDYLVGRQTDDTEREATRASNNDRIARITCDAKGLLGDGLGLAAITMGAAGAILACKEGTWHGALSGTAALEVVNTVGAGDAFFAGMIHAMAGGLDPPGILMEAISCATAKLLVHGAGAFSLANQQRFRPLVRVRRIA
jgi:1-phosphofructokinase